MENWQNLFHLFITVFLSNFSTLVVNPAIADVTMEAVCPGQDECSLAIYLTGFQQAIAGVGSVVMMPIIGTLSDVYGRKRLLTIPLTLSIIPLLLMAINRSTNFFYAYYVLKTITSMVCDGGLICISLSYLADNVCEGKRISAIGMFCGVISASTVCGTLAARLLPTAQLFQVAAVVSIIAAVYMRILLKESSRPVDPLDQPILKVVSESDEVVESLKKSDVLKKIPLPKEILRLLQSSKTVSLASMIAFFNSLGEAGIISFLMYYLKARFHFQKNEYADICLITYIGATFSNMVLMPVLGPIVGEEILLSVGLFAGFLNMLLNSIAWAAWVPYASALFGMFLALASPSIRCIVSKQVGPYEQGIAQGCLMGIAALANVASPLIYSPLSAIFLSDNSPFNFPGFSILCVGLAWLIGFVLSIMLKILPQLSRDKAHQEPVVPSSYGPSESKPLLGENPERLKKTYSRVRSLANSRSINSRTSIV